MKNIMEEVPTMDNLHNLHFEQIDFAHGEWSKKVLHWRQIFFDSSFKDTWFILDKSTSNLYLHFSNFGTKETPNMLILGKMPTRYQTAITFLAELEIKIVKLLGTHTTDDLTKIKTGHQLMNILNNLKNV